ncbi:Organic hydroperoxide resistance transcriptional regulator [Clavibacter michiganensis]|uniref:Organic hydroperoxide resistance transcriptional regulator n=1 Tax=Clavibacter michiganensis TaxID=28447 RepID=A0A251XQC9_9MICO|nr:Organic hydroperoxide resistance transcriptional regulator [Clavibacter michiganensis]
MPDAIPLDDATATPARITDELVCFSLYTASRSTTQAYRALLAPWGLTYPQYLVLVLLWSGDHRTVTELGQQLDLDSGTLSPLLARMEEAGFIARRRVSADQRVVTVSLAERGRTVRAELGHVPAAVIRGMGLDLDRARQLLATLHLLTAGMQETTADALAHPAVRPAEASTAAPAP